MITAVGEIFTSWTDLILDGVELCKAGRPAVRKQRNVRRQFASASAWLRHYIVFARIEPTVLSRSQRHSVACAVGHSDIWLTAAKP
jgi:hypothetical protein